MGWGVIFTVTGKGKPFYLGDGTPPSISLARKNKKDFEKVLDDPETARVNSQKIPMSWP